MNAAAPIVDPSNFTLPDHGAPEYAPIRNHLTGAGLSLEDAIKEMDEVWKAAQQKRVDDWNDELQRRKEDREKELAEREKKEEEERKKREDEERKEKAEEEKKRIKLPAIEKDTKISATPRFPTPQYALDRISKKQWVEHDLFTPRMARKAAVETRPASTNPFSGLPESNPLHALSTLVDTQKPRGVIADEALSYADLSIASKHFLRAIDDASWEEEHVEAWTVLYYELDKHPFRSEADEERELYEEVLVRYHAQVKREFFDSVKRKTSSVFNIGLISNERMDNVLREVRRERDAVMKKREIAAIEQIEKVCKFPITSHVCVFSTDLPDSHVFLPPLASLPPSPLTHHAKSQNRKIAKSLLLFPWLHCTACRGQITKGGVAS